MRCSFLLFAGAAAVLIVSCTESPNAPEGADTVPQYGVTQTKDYCERDPNCAGYADPDPEAPGIFLGTDITADGCATTLTDDLDQDGFKDYCEKLLAEFFRPLLKFSGAETLSGREPYWAVRWDVDETAAKIFYAFAYYEDGGSYATGCPSTQYCAGHYGDSEWIEITADFDPVSKHWMTAQGIYSQHGAGWIYAFKDLEFPGRPRGYPAVYVSLDKHANYNSDYSCDNGGFFDFDTCTPGTSVRESHFVDRNLGKSGSPTTKLKDCVLSSGRFAGNGKLECFWATTGKFNGWNTATQTYAELDVAPYGHPLYTLGY